jgi:alkanesulfonate monooxygenase SsuD/methylene tetrahydromethanopterin reductase-like flavin-dependent oxidoreductase (luciferase family)
MTMPMGATLHTGDMSFPEIAGYAREAESLGYDGFWLLEETGKEAFATLGALAGATSRIRLGTSIVSFYSRTPTLLAMSARTVDDLTGGRFALGIGAGGTGFLERGHGVGVERPLERARESVEIIRGLLTSKRFSYDSERFRIRNFGLREGPAAHKIPIYLSALNPKMMAQAARVADGFIASFPSEEAVESWREIVDREANAAGRDPRDVRMMALLLTCVDPSDDTALEALRKGLAFYCAAKTYHHIADTSGVGAEVRKVWEAWERRDMEGAARLVTDRIVEKFSLAGPPAECRKRLRKLIDAGVYPIIYPLPRPGRIVEDHLAAIRLAAGYLSAEGK